MTKNANSKVKERKRSSEAEPGYASVDELLEDDITEAEGEDFVLAKSGKKIRIRGLSRNEALAVSQAKTEKDRQLYLVRKGVIHPFMTEEQVKKWFAKVPSGDVSKLMDKITELSGMAEEAERAIALAFREESGL